MERVLSDGLWEDLRKRARKAKKKRAAIAYFTENHLSLGRGDLLVVDASDGAIKSQATNAFLLEAMHAAGVSIYSLPGLHAKVALLDNVAVIGSANSSAHSEDRLIEASLVSDSPLIVAKVQQLIDGWVEDAGRTLDRSDFKRLLGLPKTPRTWLPGTTKKRRKGDTGREQSIWVTRVDELPDDAHPNEAMAAERGEKQARKSKFSGGRDISWIRFPSLRSTFAREARPGDLIIRLWNPLTSTNLRVCPPSTLLAVRKEPTCVRMYIEETPTRMQELSFGKFTAAAKKAGITRPIGKTSSRRLKAEEGKRLLDALKAASKGGG
jgi:PLD-like domain